MSEESQVSVTLIMSEEWVRHRSLSSSSLGKRLRAIKKNIFSWLEVGRVVAEKSMDDNREEWVECMGVASGCGEQEACVASGRGWNLWVWL